MSGPSPYNALYEIFGHGWLTNDEDHQEPIKKSPIKRKKIHNEKELKHNHKKPLKIDNACQTQPLRDYSYNKVIEPSKRKNKKKNKEKCNTFKIHPNDDAKFSGNIKVHKKRTSSVVGMHLKKSHVNALYKTVSDIEKMFREERNLHLHSRKCLCSSCGALGVITESMKHPVDYSDDSSESDDELDDDDDDDVDDENEYNNAQQRYNSSKKSWKIEYKDNNESVRYGFPNAEGYLRLILELEKMIKRVRSLERLAIRYNIPIRRNKVDIAYDMQTKNSKGVSKKSNNRCLSSTSSSEIDKKQCGLFSIPNLIKRRFSKKRNLDVKEETKNEMKEAPTTLRSKNFKHKANDNKVRNLKNNTYIEVDKKFQSNCLDEKIQNFDLALLNEDEICELMFHLKNKDLNNVNRIKQKTIASSNIAGNNRVFFNQTPDVQTRKSNVIHTDRAPFKMGTSPVGLRTITEKTSQRSLRNDATFIRKSPNYLENNNETNRNTRKLFNDFLNINNVTPVEQRNETNTLRHQRHRDKNVSEESTNCYNINSVNKPQNDTVHKLNLDIKKHDQKTEKDYMKTSKDSLYHKSSNLCKKEWLNEMLNKSIGVIEEKYSQEMKISDNSIKAKIGKTVTYSKQNEYCYFRDSLIDIKSASKTYFNPIEEGESSGLCKQILPVEQIESSDSDVSEESETYDNIPLSNRKMSEIFLPVIRKSPQSRIEVDVNKEKHVMYNVSDNLKGTIMKEDLGMTNVKMAENNNQFKYEPETHLLRSELRSQNEKTTCKASIEPVKNQHDEKIAEFISKNIFEKPSIKEKTTDSILKDIQRSYKKDNEESKSLQKRENKQITEDENIHKIFCERTKNIQKSKFLDKNISSHIKANTEVKSSQTCETSKNLLVKNKIIRKENKATQITEINEEAENKFSLKKGIVKTKRNVENKNVSTDETLNTKDRENIQKKFRETKSSNVKSNEVKNPQMFGINKNLVRRNSSLKRKENTGTQVTGMNVEKENIIEEIHECPLSYIFNNYPSFNAKNTNSQVMKKSILKTYKRAINETPLKLDKKNSVVINKFKKHVNLNIVQKVSSSIIHDIFNRRTSHNASLTKVFKRKKHSIKKEKHKITYSRIPIPIISHKIKKDIVPNINNSPKNVSRIPIYSRKVNSKATFENKFNLKIPKKKAFNRNQNNILIHCNVVKNTLTSKFTKKNEIGNSQETIVIGKTIYKNYITPKTVSTKKKVYSKIPVFQEIHNKNQQNKVCNKSITSKSLGKSNLVTNSKKAPILSSSIITNNDLPSTFPQHIKLYPAFITASSSPNTREQEENNKRLSTDSYKNNLQIKKVEHKIDTDSKNKAKVLPVSSDVLNSFNSEIEKVQRKIDTDSEDEAKVSSLNSDILNSFNSEIDKVELKVDSDIEDEAKTLPVNSDILNSYNSEIEKNERKKGTDSEIEVNMSVNSDILNSYNSEIEKVKRKIDTDSSNEAKLLPVDSDILNSYNSQIERVECKINPDFTSNKAKVLFADSDILNSYNSQIERIERKLDSDCTDDEKNSNYLTTESRKSEEKSYYITPPYAIKSYASSSTFSEGSSGAVFIYKSKCQLGTDSEFDTRISESVYTSTSDLNPSKKNKKWKWLKTFGSKFKSFLSVHTPKSSTVESFLMDANTSCNVSNEICNEQHLKKKVDEDNFRKNCKIKWNNKPKASLSFTLSLKKKNINSSILLN